MLVHRRRDTDKQYVSAQAEGLDTDKQYVSAQAEGYGQAEC